jgi:hypothetical protein
MRGNHETGGSPPQIWNESPRAGGLLLPAVRRTVAEAGQRRLDFPRLLRTNVLDDLKPWGVTVASRKK